MPKLRMTEQQRRERVLVGAVARAMAEEDLHTDAQAGQFVGIPESSFWRYRRDKFQKIPFQQFCKMARRLNLTGWEVCAAIGIPYADDGIWNGMAEPALPSERIPLCSVPACGRLCPLGVINSPCSLKKREARCKQDTLPVHYAAFGNISFLITSPII